MIYSAKRGGNGGACAEGPAFGGGRSAFTVVGAAKDSGGTRADPVASEPPHCVRPTTSPAPLPSPGRGAGSPDGACGPDPAAASA